MVPQADSLPSCASCFSTSSPSNGSCSFLLQHQSPTFLFNGLLGGGTKANLQAEASIALHAAIWPVPSTQALWPCCRCCPRAPTFASQGVLPGANLSQAHLLAHKSISGDIKTTRIHQLVYTLRKECSSKSTAVRNIQAIWGKKYSTLELCRVCSCRRIPAEGGTTPFCNFVAGRCTHQRIDQESHWPGSTGGTIVKSSSACRSGAQ